MLYQILLLLQANPPGYTHIQQNDGNYITCCTFSKEKSYLPDINVEKIYGSPSPTIQSSKEVAALKSLEHLDASYQLRLYDYNFKAKEDLIDENRSLIHARE